MPAPKSTLQDSHLCHCTNSCTSVSPWPAFQFEHADVSRSATRRASLAVVANAADSRASCIKVSISYVSTPVSASVTVVDDGHGIALQSLLLAGQPGATSKAGNGSRSSGGGAFGYRGQALHAAMECCKVVSISSSVRGSAVAATLLDARVSVRRAPVDYHGTSVTCHGVFHQAPLRLPRDAKKQSAAIRRDMLLFSICVGCSIQLTWNGETLLCTAQRSTEELLSSLLGFPVTEHEQGLNSDDADQLQGTALRRLETAHIRGCRVEGYVGVGAPSAAGQVLLVNCQEWTHGPQFETLSTTVHSLLRSVEHAPLRDLRVRRSKPSMVGVPGAAAGLHPTYLLHFSAAAGDVDMNFSADKQEIVVGDFEALRQLAQRAVHGAFGTQLAHAAPLHPKHAEWEPPPGTSWDLAHALSTPGTESDLFSHKVSTSHVHGLIEAFSRSLGSMTRSSPELPLRCGRPPAGSLTRAFLKAAYVVGQVDHKFIAVVAPGQHGEVTLAFIDQHAAHERVRLHWLTVHARRQVMAESEGPTQVQHAELAPHITRPLSIEDKATGAAAGCRFEDTDLTLPVVAKVTNPRPCPVPEPLLCAATSSAARAWGVQVGDTGALLTLPVVARLPLSVSDVWEFLEGIRRAPAGLQQHAWAVMPPAAMRVLRGRACRGAVMFNTPMSRQSMVTLLGRLAEVESPFTCAHGRPSIAPIHSWVPTSQD